MSPEALLPIALEAVAAACGITRAAQQSREAFSSLTKDDRSPVTVADFASQAVVSLILQERLPNPAHHALIGEEDAAELRTPEQALIREGIVQLVRRWKPTIEESEVIDAIDAGNSKPSSAGFWTLDPIDGTKGFLRGQQFAIALAWIQGGHVRLGVMGCPGLPIDQSATLDQPDPDGVIYAACENGGTWEYPDCDPLASPMRVAARAPGSIQRIRFCGSVEKAHGDRSQAGQLIDSLGGGEAIAVDSQCKYGLVARGQADVYLRMPRTKAYIEKIWDHAAGSIIATESGARVSDINGKPLDFSCGSGLPENSGIVAAAPELHPKLIDGIRELQLGPKT